MPDHTERDRKIAKVRAELGAEKADAVGTIDVVLMLYDVRNALRTQNKLLRDLAERLEKDK